MHAQLLSCTRLPSRLIACLLLQLTAAADLRGLGGAQAFASPERVAEMVAKVRAALQSSLPSSVARLKLYVRNPTTHAVLLRPIKSNIVEAHSQIAQLLAAEYQPEEAAAANLPSSAELASLLDGLLDKGLPLSEGVSLSGRSSS